MKALYILYVLILCCMFIFSFGFVDANFTVHLAPAINNFINTHRFIALAVYITMIAVFFLVYIVFMRRASKAALSKRTVALLIIATVGILLASYPAFSYDIFNYIATAKMAYFYRENPYLIMPIEIPNEPMLAYMHAANKTALYGPVWIGLTAIPWILGFGSILVTLLTFKVIVAIFYCATVVLIWKMSGRKLVNTVFFALNPLVLIETLVSGHNDIVMMFFALFSFYLLSRKKSFLAGIALIFSILIKYATLILLPVYCYVMIRNLKNQTINWSRIWKVNAVLMFIMVLLGPLREELYPWYFIWPLTFIALIPQIFIVYAVSIAFSFGLELRFAPFVYFKDWGGLVPRIKQIVTLAFPAGSLISWIVVHSRYEKRKNN